MSELTVGTLSGLAANSYVIDVASGSQLTQPGMVLQVVTATASTNFASTSTSFTDVTGMSATITPSSATNKILIVVTASVQTSTTNDARFTIARGGTNLGDATNGMLITEGLNGLHRSAAMSFVDSPSSTSALTYTMQAKVSSSTVNVLGGSTGSITVMEIAG